MNEKQSKWGRKDYMNSYRKKNKEKLKLNNFNWRCKNRDKVTGYRLKDKYGISVEQKNLMILSQENKCAICGNGFKNERDCHVDHEHTTKRVRGILCHKCNVGLGLFRDNIFILSNATRYLERYRG